MLYPLELTLAPEIALNEPELENYIFKKLGLRTSEPVVIRRLRQSIDARGRQVKVRLHLEVYIGEAPPPMLTLRQTERDVSGQPTVLVIGSGPAGLFAAMRLIALGYRPLVLERGKDVQSRRRDLAAINKDHVVNPDSNYCFGEGGAGTYSDGKLYTRSNKRGDIRSVLELFALHGASEQILADAHPHIGTNKLPKIIASMRGYILQCGGEVLFGTRVTDLVVTGNRLKGVVTGDGREFHAGATILATGHSARDIFELLHRKGITIEHKPFAMGIRIEHPQATIDGIQYHCAGTGRGPYLPAASYSLVSQVSHRGIQRGVFSFCMCPGGFIVPAATSPGEVVVNGMSPSRRDSPYANSGLVAAVTEADLRDYRHAGPLAGMRLQAEIEQRAFGAAGGTQSAPAQRALDFTRKQFSATLNSTSYQPGLTPADLYEVLPEWLAESLRNGLQYFGHKMKGYLSNEAQLVGVESRTSSPVRIPRNPDTCEHPQIKGLFPCGEGAGYAGGIMSAAMDGERCAEAVAVAL